MVKIKVITDRISSKVPHDLCVVANEFFFQEQLRIRNYNPTKVNFGSSLVEFVSNACNEATDSHKRIKVIVPKDKTTEITKELKQSIKQKTEGRLCIERIYFVIPNYSSVTE